MIKLHQWFNQLYNVHPFLFFVYSWFITHVLLQNRLNMLEIQFFIMVTYIKNTNILKVFNKRWRRYTSLNIYVILYIWSKTNKIIYFFIILKINGIFDLKQTFPNMLFFLFSQNIQIEIISCQRIFRDAFFWRSM